MEVILESSSPVTAVFAGYDDIVYGAWDALHKRGLTVPDDVSLVGFHDEDQAQFKVPPLTTIHVDKFGLGRQLARMAIDKLKVPGKRLPEVIVPTSLVKRGTTRPLARDSAAAETVK